MPTPSPTSPPPPVKTESTRLYSLDVYRGLVMFLLVGEGAAFYHALGKLDAPWIKPIAHQFEHVAWRGLVMWDVIQPAFMFIVGVSMAFSLRKRRQRGQAWPTLFRHTLIRCAILFVLGTGLHCLYADRLVFELWNVLTQLSFTILVTFMIIDFPWKLQVVISILLILVTDLAYRLIHIAPFDATFVPGRNFGAWMDLQLMGKVNEGHWVAINAVPTAAHTIWGALAGRWLLSKASPTKKCAVLAAAGALLIVAGYVMDFTGLAPIIKRICTSSFVVASGGWCVLALFCLIYDVLKWRWGSWWVVVVGMNPIAIYLITEALAWGWLNPKVGIFTGDALANLGVAASLAALATATATWALLWSLCVWLYRKNIFIRI
ncbi:MAG: DUF5009 domain-containing protein [Planctomycetota bacterium]